MKKPEIARSIARRSKLTPAQAADRLDRIVHEIVINLRRGRPSSLPGLGVFGVDSRGQIRFDKDKSHGGE